jgi:short-subunit dehydrogenase
LWNAARNALPRVPFVNTASMAGFLSDTGFGAYTASKFAVVGISEALSTELEP